jgi:hypothetical protein
VFTALLTAGTSLAQQAPRPNPAPAPGTRGEQPRPERRAEAPATADEVKGGLVRVDTDTKTLVVKTADGTQERVPYTDSTKVTGAEGGVAALADAAGVEVTIKVTGKGADRVATDITIDKKS